MEPLPPRVRVSVLTFNVHGIPPERHTKLDRWLLDGPSGHLRQKPVPALPVDVYVIGLQEVIPLKLYKLVQLVGSENEKMSAKWAAKLEKLLSKAGDFALYAREHMWGIHAFVFVNRQLANSPYITNMSRGHIATGIANVFGDKGAVGIRFNLFDRSLCFVCCHLEAGEGEDRCRERNEDHDKIGEKLVFRQGGSVADHDVVFYFGDLNYRLTGPGDGSSTKKILREQGYQALLEQDELLNRTCTGTAFDGCEEMPLTFDPTYKWKHYTNKVDTSERLAWTDRVIWRVQDPASQPGMLDSQPALKIVPLAYGRAEVKTSDHRPVFGVFDIMGSATYAPENNLKPKSTGVEPIKPIIHSSHETNLINNIQDGGPPTITAGLEPNITREASYVTTVAPKPQQTATEHLVFEYQQFSTTASTAYIPAQPATQAIPSLYPQLGGLVANQLPPGRTQLNGPPAGGSWSTLGKGSHSNPGGAAESDVYSVNRGADVPRFETHVVNRRAGGIQ